MKPLIFLFMVINITMITSCKKDKMDDELSIQRTPYYGNELRIDGYYYNEYFEGYITVYFFYQNGIILYGSSFPINEISILEDEYKSGLHYEHSRNNKPSWGVFIIEDNKICFERWYPSEIPFKAFVSEGEILNDSTFIITESYRVQNDVKTLIQKENNTYHFKQFSPKPDSLNPFIN